LKQHLERLYRGEISFDTFARLTQQDWNRLATRIYNNWRRKLPRGVELIDVRQEMLVAAWRTIPNYDPARGVSLRSFVVFNACAKALRWLHEQRNAKRRSEQSESRFPTTFSEYLPAMLDGSKSDMLTNLMVDDTLPVDDLFAVAESFSLAMHRARGADLYAMVAFRRASGDLHAAGNELFGESTLALRMRWNGPRDAVSYIELAVTKNMKEVEEHG
jgi:DNA-directed RNA polymerase specialized sigma24 family protein